MKRPWFTQAKLVERLGDQQGKAEWDWINQTIKDGHIGNKPKDKSHRCCDQARIMYCVCLRSTYCPAHGETHCGTHD